MPAADLGVDALRAWGESYGARLVPPAVVTLEGDLGAGKTTLAQAICRGYGVTEAVTSPTFALVHQYASPRSPVFHLDLYRLESSRDLAGMGWEDVLVSPGLVLIEWPERAGSERPGAAATIVLEHIAGEPEQRRLRW